MGNDAGKSTHRALNVSSTVKDQGNKFQLAYSIKRPRGGGGLRLLVFDASEDPPVCRIELGWAGPAVRLPSISKINLGMRVQSNAESQLAAQSAKESMR